MDFGLKASPGGASDADIIKDSTTASFAKDVLEASRAVPVIVDFWAAWCGPCKQLTPVLEKVVKSHGGKVRLVLLPAPELRFDEVKVADEKGSFDKPLIEARSFEAWLNIGALLRGAIEARKIVISEPVLRLAVKEDGTGNWSDVGRAGEALPFAPKEVLLDEVSISGGRVEFTRPGSQPLVFEDVYGAGSAASLSGPYKVSASYIFGGRPQELRFSTSASDPEGIFRLKSALRDPDRNTTYLLEGDVGTRLDRRRRLAAGHRQPAADLRPGRQPAQRLVGLRDRLADRERPRLRLDLLGAPA